MRRHELELISSLAEGTLDDESEARALIESSAELRAEYKAQKAAIDAVRGISPAIMTDAERASLRRDVWAELRNAEPARRTPWYLRRSAFAAAMILVVGSLAVLGQMTSEMQATGAPSDVASDLGEQASSATDYSESGTDGGSSQPGTIETPAAAPEVDASTWEDMADSIRSGEADSAFRLFREEGRDDSVASECLAAAGLGDQLFLGEMETPTGDTVLVASSDQDPGPDTPISFIHPASCELIFTVG